jgi:class 3 adenylate cyclase/ABC-type transport system involved in cytochrome c biogenesis ATPase subunit
MKGITEWLASIGLSEYAQRFADNGIDLSVIRDLTEQDLKDLGVLLGHRRKMLRAIAELDGVAPAPTETATEPVARDEPERRHLTVMICDLVGSTALSARLDPEDMRAVIDAYHAACARITRTYDGFLAEFRGDGILAYFGYPRAHEDDAERTVRAGLDIIAAVARLETRAGEPLAVRIGIATGVVLIGDLSGEGALRKRAVVGDTPNLAARLQALAEPGTIVVAASTRRLLGDLFRLRDLGRHEVKGIAEPVAAWAVEGVSDSESRFEAARAAGLTDLIDRESELGFLLERQRLAWKGEGQIVLISGEPGIGKSRLVAALAERIAGEPHTRLRYQCSPYHNNSALRPFVAQLERAAAFKADDTSEQRLDKLEALLALGASQVQAAPLFAALLSIPFGERYPPLALSPTQQRRRTLAALLDQFEGLARRQPILLSFEDAQWADATSLELLDLTVERVRQLPVLALFTFRPEFEPPWAGLPNVGTLTLGRLDHNDVENMVARVTGGRMLPAEVMKQIVAKTDGNPLFVEELTKTVLEAGILVENHDGYRLDGPLPPLAIPTTLQDSLMARLDRLAPVREIAQIGAAIGREFSYSLLRALVGRDESALKDGLAQLEQAELVFRRGEPPDAVYSFKHVLVRDAAYESLLKSRRQQLHGQIARTLEQSFADIVASQPEIVAHHFTEAGLAEPAIDYWLKAGQQAARRSANAEALNHFARGLDLLPKLGDPMLRNKSELVLQTSLGHSLRAIKGWSIDSVKHAYTRALQLGKESGFDENTLPAAFGLWTWNFVHAALGEAQSLAERLVNIAENVDDSVYKVLAHEALGFTLFAHGKFAAAHAALQHSLSMCENSKAAAYLDLSAQDPRVHVRLYGGMALWFLGYPDQALRICAEARHYADTSRHPFSEAMVRTITLRVHQLRGEAAVVPGQANAAIALCEEHGFVHYLAMALILRGWARAQQGEFEKGIAEIQAGLEKERATGALLFESYTLGLLADACIKNERYGQAFDFLAPAQSRLDEENSERFYAAEIYRLLGETYLRSRRDLDQAERYLCKGLEVAREQKAKSLELKLCLSMYDLYELRQNADKYRSQLGKIYESFGEGFDTTDLVKAKGRLKNPSPTR